MTTVATLNIEALEERTPFVNVLVYGEAGVGKTVFASTAPRPILWLDSEGGTASISDKKGIDVARVSGLDTYREAVDYLEANPDTYQTVVFDSFTETQAHILKGLMRKAKALDPTRDEHLPQFDEYRVATGIMRAIIREFRDLPIHVVITALQREDKDDLTGRVRIRPRLLPTFADELPGFLDAVLYLHATTANKGEVDEEGIAADDEGVTVIRNALIKPTGKYAAKIRAPKGTDPPDFITDPTFDNVAELLGL